MPPPSWEISKPAESDVFEPEYDEVGLTNLFGLHSLSTKWRAYYVPSRSISGTRLAYTLSKEMVLRYIKLVLDKQFNATYYMSQIRRDIMETVIEKPQMLVGLFIHHDEVIYLTLDEWIARDEEQQAALLEMAKKDPCK